MPSMTSTAAAVLDDPLEWQMFSEPALGQGEAELVRSHVALQGITCAACAVTIEEAVRHVAGVADVRVDAASARARIVWDQAQTAPSRWFEAIERAGYRALPAPDALSLEDRRRERRRLLWRWIVAGFCMMQVMMYAYPVYIAQPGEMAADSLRLMQWASWVLTLPVLLFSCGPFFASALRDLSRGSIGMDVPVALGILITFVVSSAVTFGAGPAWGHEVWFDSLTMFVFFLLSGRWLELSLRERTTGALDELTRRLPQTVTLVEADGTLREASARRLSVGDLVRVRAGESFAADGRIMEGRTHVDEALLTGESTALDRGPGDAVLAGSHNLSHTVDVAVTRLGADTRYGQIVALVERAGFDKPAIAALADRIARPFLVAVLLAAALAFWWWWPTDPSRAWAAAVAVLIVTCPCALSLATPAAMVAAAGALARDGVLVRGLRRLETLARVDTVVFDKTGTLTLDRPRVARVVCSPRIDAAQALRLAGGMALQSLHPVSRAIVDAARGQGVEPLDFRVGRIEELPGKGLRVTGATIVPAAGAAYEELRLGSVTWCDVESQSEDGGPESVLCDSQGWLASFVLEEALRPDAVLAVRELAGLGVSTQLLSGDGDAAARRLALRAGVLAARGDCAPDTKLRHVEALQRAGHRVAMVGDGVNDAPVLARADVSFAMGHAAPLAQSRADFVVQGDRLVDIARSVSLARRTMAVVRQNLLWAAVYNAICVPLAVAGSLPAWAAGLGMAFSSLLVVANAARLSRPARAAVPANMAEEPA